MHDRSRLQPPEICNSLRNSLWGRPAIGGNLASAIVRRLLRPGVSEPPTAGVLDVDPPRPGEGVERSHALLSPESMGWRSGFFLISFLR